MRTYTCVVSDPKGNITTLVRNGSSAESILSGLQREGYYPVSIVQRQKINGQRRKGISGKSLIDFTALISILLNSGLGIRDGIEIMQHASRDKDVVSLASGLEKEMKKGASFYSAMGTCAPSLPPLYSSMIRVGETTGDLVYIFKKLNEYLQRRKAMREKLISSMIYPVIVLCVAAASMILITTSIIPKMKEMFTGLGSTVPERMEHILSMSGKLLNASLIAGVFFLLFGIFAVFFSKHSQRLHTFVDRITMRIPVAGAFVKDNEFMNILFTLNALVSSGVPMEQALEVVVTAVSNTVLKEVFMRVHEKVLKGIPLSKAFRDEKFIPVKISGWIAVGERTGSLKQTFSQLLSYYEIEIEKKTTRFMSLIEPALILVTGILVFAMVLLVIVPLYSSFGALLQ